MQFPPIKKQDLSRTRSWIRSDKKKAEIFAKLLSKILESNLREIILKNRLSNAIAIVTYASATYAFFTVKEVRVVIRDLNPKKASDYDFIINQIL